MSGESPFIENAYRYCPHCSVANPSVAEVPFRCRECGYTSYFGPVGAVGGLIVNHRNELLLVRRARDPGKGKWGLPGGFIDRYETAEQALAREVREETGLQLMQCCYLISAPNKYAVGGFAAPVIDLFFCGRVEESQPIVLQDTELDDYEWTRPTEQHLDNLAFHSNRLAIEFWLRQ